MDKFVVKQKRKSPEPESPRSPEKKSKIEEKLKKTKEEGAEKKQKRFDGKTKNIESSEVRKPVISKEKKEKKKEEKPKETVDNWLGKSLKKVEKMEEKPAKKVEIPKEKKKKEEKVTVKKEKPATKKPESSKPKESEQNKARNSLASAAQLPETVNEVGNLLGGFRGKAISDEDMDKLVRALCGDTGKTFDSDDSILSDIDRMDAEEIARRDQKFRETIEYLDELPNKMEALNAVLNQGNETKEEREKRRRVVRELRDGLKTREERDRAERRRLREVKAMETRLARQVIVFNSDWDRKSKLDTSPPMISCTQLAGFLEMMAEFVPNDKKSEEAGGNVDFRAQIKHIDMDALEKKIKYGPIRGTFYTGGLTAAEYLQKKVSLFFKSPDVLDVLDGHRYGFEFSTKDCLLVLENYYSMNKPRKDNGASIDALSIQISKLLRSAFHVARSDNPHFVLNDALKAAMFD